MDIAGNVALIPGGTSGLGLAVARRLLASGARVVAMGRSAERAEKAVAELGQDICFSPGDVTEPDDVAGAVAAAQRLGRLGIVVNCAGVVTSGRVLGRDHPLPLAKFEQVVRVNLIGTFNVVRLAAQAMATNTTLMGDRGVIVCTSSIAAYDGQQGQAAYAASKAGIVGMTLPLARDLAKHAIRVVTVAPGLFHTPMVAELREHTRDALAGQTPHPTRLGEPDEFASLVAHVIENPMLNGGVIRLDGALRLGVV
ncbi:MAG TPA: SDR family NAD(P)-dependent oxidoreductase [Micromonosporaceae bacterium]|nr:SDR family NAD(P)-dependent oxidoreductase [Micromonosporaceae bacterium]